MSTSQGPLAGIKVVEFGQNLAGPYCGQILAFLGACLSRGDSEHVFGDMVNGLEISVAYRRRSMALSTTLRKTRW